MDRVRHYPRVHRIDPNLSSLTVFRMLGSLPKPASSIIVLLWTGHVALIIYLKKIKASTTVLCDHCQSRQPVTVADCLLKRRASYAQRLPLKHKVGRHSSSMQAPVSESKVPYYTMHHGNQPIPKYTNAGRR